MGKGFVTEYDGIKLRTMGFKSNFTFLDSLNINYNAIKSSRKKAINLVSKIKKNNFIALLVLDSSRLSYKKQYINSPSSAHYVICQNITFDKKFVFLKDGYIFNDSDIPFQGFVDIDTIFSAWKKWNYEMLVFPSFTAVTNNNFFKNVDNQVYEQISSYVMRKQHCEKYYGYLAAIKYLCNCKKTIDSKVSLFEVGKNINYQFKKNGFLQARYYLRNWLFERNNNNYSQIDSTIELYNDYLMNLLYYGVKNNNYLFIETIDKLVLLIKKERNLFKNISGEHNE